MSRDWQLLCYAIAAVCFAVAFFDFHLSLTTRRRPQPYTISSVNWIALGLLAVTMVPLVSTINSP